MRRLPVVPIRRCQLLEAHYFRRGGVLLFWRAIEYTLAELADLLLDLIDSHAVS